MPLGENMEGARTLIESLPRSTTRAAFVLGASCLALAALLGGCGPKCEGGREASGKYCCWPGQRWSDERDACTGKATCPAGMHARAGGCMGALPKCDEGMVGVGAASFHMGTNRPGIEWQGSRPVREVKVSAFCLDRTEVTVAAYKTCVDAGKCSAPASGRKGDDWVDPACKQLLPERMTHPVNCIDWRQADAYCRWANKRLPTEAEWQLAAGRMDGRRFAWGDAPPGADKANLRGGDGEVDNPLYRGSDGWRFTAPVGSFAADASPFGAVDMGGNAKEWSSTEVENAMRIHMGGEYSGSHKVEIRSRFGASPSQAAGWNSVRCARSSGR